MSYRVIENPNRNAYVFPPCSDFFIVCDGDTCDNGTYTTREQAQKRADVLNTDGEFDFFRDFGDSDTAIDYFGNRGETPEQVEDTTTPEQAAEVTGLVFHEKYHAGNLIDHGKYTYRVIADSFFVSEQEARQDFDIASVSGWYTKVELKKEGI